MAFPVYFDEDSVNRALIRSLVARGMDVTNAIDAGHATADGRVLFTYNVGDFFALHRQFRQDGRSHAGLILAVQQRYSVGEQMRRLLRMNRERPRKSGIRLATPTASPRDGRTAQGQS